MIYIILFYKGIFTHFFQYKITNNSALIFKFYIYHLKCQDNLLQSIFALFRFLHNNHILLYFIRIGIIILLNMSHLGTFHPFFTFLLIFLFGTFLFYILQIINQILHFLFPCLFIWLNAIDHWVDSLLSLLIILIFSFFHILLDNFRSFDSKVILNDVYILINLWNLLIFV